MTGAFDDPQHCLAHPLDSREPPPARDAFTAAADSLTKFHLARVHDPIFGRPTPRAAHELTVAPIGYQRARPSSPFSAAGIGAGAAPRAQNPLRCRQACRLGKFELVAGDQQGAVKLLLELGHEWPRVATGLEAGGYGPQGVAGPNRVEIAALDLHGRGRNR